MNILVTGGAGFIGSNLVHYLLGEASAELGVPIDKVVTLDKLTYAGNRSNLEDLDSDPRHVFAQGDICDEKFVASLLRAHAIDAVMHLAAESHVDRSIDGPEAFIMTNVVGTFRLLDAFRKYLAETGRDKLPNHGKSIADGGESITMSMLPATTTPFSCQPRYARTSLAVYRSVSPHRRREEMFASEPCSNRSE